MKRKLNHGLLITFEGGEGAGKSTVMKHIHDELVTAGYPVFATREPGGTALGEAIRELVLADRRQKSISVYAELCLFLASRAEHLQEMIIPQLETQAIVLCDRFNDSTIAYQGIARNLGAKKVEGLCSFICQDIRPHLTLYLDIDPVIGLARSKGSDRIEAEGLPFHKKVRKGFLSLYQKDKKRIKLINANQPLLQVINQAMRHIELLL